MIDSALPAPLVTRLRAMYAEPQRYYHTLAHVEALRRGLAHWQSLAREPRLIDAAIWFHDAVYDTRRSDNEPRSAELARVELAALGWAAADVERVAALVLATQHHQADADDTDAWLFLDLDLSVLAQSAARYAAYGAAVRAEYAWVDEARYREGRSAVLRSFLDRAAIYRTPELHATWEAAARTNLAAELSALI
ncbi:MAG: N-methyl-D-aspartate receptor NMDAR2C subunit [Burkholderiales bacterium]